MRSTRSSGPNSHDAEWDTHLVDYKVRRVDLDFEGPAGLREATAIQLVHTGDKKQVLVRHTCSSAGDPISDLEDPAG